MLISKLSGDENQNIEMIKNRFGCTTNSQAVSHMLSYYAPNVDRIHKLEKELQEVKAELFKRKLQAKALFESLESIREFSER